MAKKTKTKEVTEDQIITKYIDYVLEQEVVPKSIFKFCRTVGITESDFYQYYGSIEALRKGIWKKFYTNTESLLLKNKEYAGFTNKDKMLAFFYSFFELLTLNRSYVLFTLHNERSLLGKLDQLKGLHKHIRSFAMTLIEESNAHKTLKITQHNPMLFAEGVWFEFLFILKFWLDDDSAGFEKTDMAIEKSINTIFDIFDNTPIDNIVDFGKFLFKEKMQ
jgi:AcrR family transcriptional regulator